MKTEFAVVPPGGGETDYSFEFETPALPSADDYIFKQDAEKGEVIGYATFIVTRRRFISDAAGDRVVVEIEPARSSLESPAHKSLCEMYAKRGKQVKVMPDSCY